MSEAARTRTIGRRKGWWIGWLSRAVTMLACGAVALGGFASFAARGRLEAVLFFAVLVLYAWVIRRFSILELPRDAQIGVDGVVIRSKSRLGSPRRRFLHWTQFDAVVASDDDVILERDHIEMYRIENLADPRVVAASIRKGRDRYRARERRGIPGAVEGRDVDALVATLTGDAYRSAAITAEELAGIAADPTVRIEVRAVAGAAAGKAGSEQTRLRVRVASEQTACQELAELFEEAARGRIDREKLRKIEDLREGM